MKHISVLKEEAISLLNIKKDGIYVDATLGRAGHSIEIVKRLDKGKLYCFDLDEEAINASKLILKDYLDKVILINDNYCNMFNYVTKIDGILLDLGVSSPQFDDETRGFSYRYDTKLDMRMNQNQSFSAFDLINDYSLKELSEIFKEYGQDRFSYQIAKKIVKRRELKKIETSFELVELIKEAKPSKVLKEKGHPAKQIFQAIRIAVNDEINSLVKFLKSFDEHLNKGACVSIISFHSLEDRLVKKRFVELSSINDDKRLIIKESELPKPRFQLLNKKVLVASLEEIEANPRSKSAKLRGIRKL